MKFNVLAITVLCWISDKWSSVSGDNEIKYRNFNLVANRPQMKHRRLDFVYDSPRMGDPIESLRQVIDSVSGVRQGGVRYRRAITDGVDTSQEAVRDEGFQKMDTNEREDSIRVRRDTDRHSSEERKASAEDKQRWEKRRNYLQFVRNNNRIRGQIIYEDKLFKNRNSGDSHSEDRARRWREAVRKTKIHEVPQENENFRNVQNTYEDSGFEDRRKEPVFKNPQLAPENGINNVQTTFDESLVDGLDRKESSSTTQKIHFANKHDLLAHFSITASAEVFTPRLFTTQDPTEVKPSPEHTSPVFQDNSTVPSPNEGRFHYTILFPNGERRHYTFTDSYETPPPTPPITCLPYSPGEDLFEYYLRNISQGRTQDPDTLLTRKRIRLRRTTTTEREVYESVTSAPGYFDSSLGKLVDDYIDSGPGMNSSEVDRIRARDAEILREGLEREKRGESAPSEDFEESMW